MKYQELTHGKTIVGKYYVRPLNWAGIWNKNGELVGCNTLYEFGTEEESIKCISMSDIAVYKINDYEWWASKLPLDETIKYYERVVDKIDDYEEIEECDIDTDGMWWSTEEEKDIKELGDNDELSHKPIEFGDLMKNSGDVYKYIPLRLALMKFDEINEPFCLASTEW